MRPVSASPLGAFLTLTTTLGGCDDPTEAHDDDYAPTDEKGDIFGGVDDRIERHELELIDPRYELARSSAALFNGGLARSSFGGWLVTGGNLQRRKNLCNGEAFAKQPAGADCSGTLVGPDLVLTAGHCIPNEEGLSLSSPKVQSACNSMKVAFDYAYDVEGDDPSRLADEDVFQCKKVLAREFDRAPTSLFPPWLGPWLDYAVIKLDRPVPGRYPVTLQDGGGIGLHRTVTQIGHPSGLPQKLVDGSVTQEAQCRNFHHDGDVFGGNSGGGVFDPLTGKIVGVVIRRPDIDEYVWDASRGCKVTSVCGDNINCFWAPLTLANGIPFILSRLSNEVKNQLDIAEVGGPSKCR